MSKKAKVSLIQFTQNPLELCAMVRRVMHSPIPDTLEEFIEDPEKWLGMSLNDYIKNVLLNDKMPTFLEYVNLSFKLENVSRALAQQLTRHRIGFSYSIQSMRCVDLPNFADEGNYYNPYSLNKDGAIAAAYDRYMVEIQNLYREALENDMPTQDARGLLPLNIYSTVTFSCSLRALIGMLNKRLCQKTQDEFREVAKMMMKEIELKMDKRILKWIGPPCEVNGYCMMKGENEIQYKEGKFKASQNTNMVCPKYIKIFKDGKKNE